jgi:hypothetical protein
MDGIIFFGLSKSDYAFGLAHSQRDFQDALIPVVRRMPAANATL